MVDDDIKLLRDALAGDLMMRQWRDGGCNTVDGLTADGEWWEVCHPMPLDGTADYIAAASPDRVQRLLDEIASLRRDRDHWKANHATEVQRARVLKERTDMPLERVQAYEQIGVLQQEIENLRFSFTEWLDKTEWVQQEVQAGTLPESALGKHRADIMREEVERLRKFENDVESEVATWLDVSPTTEGMTPTERTLLAVRAVRAEVERLREIARAIASLKRFDPCRERSNAGRRVTMNIPVEVVEQLDAAINKGPQA